MKPQIIIIDDSELDAMYLVSHLNRVAPEWEIHKVFNSPETAIEYLRFFSPFALFTDIEMPAIDGFDLIDKLSPIDYPVIFVTGYQDFAIRAFEIAAIDYLVKPVNESRLRLSMKKINKFKQADQHIRLDVLKQIRRELTQPVPKTTRIVVNSQSAAQVLKIKNIIRCEAAGSYTHIYSIDNKKITASKSLKYFESILPLSDFSRIHRSHLVNIDFIDQINKVRGEVLLTTGERLPVTVDKLGVNLK